MTFIFPKKLGLIPIFIKIATLKVLFKEKKNECTSNTSVYSYVLWQGLTSMESTHSLTLMNDRS